MSTVMQDRCLSCPRPRCWAQRYLLLAAGLVLLLSPPTCFAVSTPLSLSNEIEAISFMEHGATTASLEPNPAPIESDSQAAALFGMETEPLIVGTVLEKWTRAKSEIAVELETVAYCRANDACPAVA